MANNITKLVFKYEGLRTILKSGGVLADLTGRAHAVASAAGPGFAVDSGVGPNRARAAVYTATHEAAVAEATGRVLLRALGSAR